VQQTKVGLQRHQTQPLIGFHVELFRSAVLVKQGSRNRPSSGAAFLGSSGKPSVDDQPSGKA
jgi:hypothetical protein